MSTTRVFILRHARRIVAGVAIVVAYAMTRLPTLAEPDRSSLADRFAFSGYALPEVPGPPQRSIRDVHPDLARHAGWVSVVGASVAIYDLDGDGLANDVCYVETRTDQVIVTPVPGTGDRYAPFVLESRERLAARGAESRTVAPMGCLCGDFNEDGSADMLVYYWGRTPVVFLRRDAANPGAPDAPDADAYMAVDLVPGDERWFTNAATTADVDGDGHVDIVIGNYFADDARILDPEAAPAANGENDMQDSMSRAFNGGRDRILLWQGGRGGATPDVRFVDVENVFVAPIGMGWTLGIAAGDLDGDLLPELYLANDFGPDRLLHNRSTPGAPRFEVLTGRKTMRMPASKVLGRDSFKGMGVDFGDMNGDGLLDIYVSNITGDFALEESHFLFCSTGETDLMADGVAPYVDRSEPLGVSRSGWGWESRFADFDNDGVLELVQATGFIRGRTNRWPELHELAMANDTLLHRAGSWPELVEGDDLSGHQHNPFFVRSASGRYFDIAPDIGLDDTTVTRGIATADVDGDGDLDFVIANQWEPSRFFRNDAPDAGAFLGLDVRHAIGETRGFAAIGATAVVTLPDGRRLVGQVDGGNGHSGARSPQLHFGLGRGLGPHSADATVHVELRWRDREGVVRTRAMDLAPGWHTVWLGAGEGDV